MSDMVERVARAICNRQKPKPYEGDAFDNLKTWADVDDSDGDSRRELDGYYADARAAIEAMVEPTDEMVAEAELGYITSMLEMEHNSAIAKGVYQSMLRSALVNRKEKA